MLSAAEADLLRTCARARIDNETAMHVRELLAGTIDWKRVLTAAEQHCVLPLIASTLRASAGDILPSEISVSLAAKLQGYALETMRLSGELVRLMAALHAASIPALSFKGATLGALAYGNLALRPFGDLDILVNPQDAAKAVRVLESLGFPGWEADRNVSVHLRGEAEETFIRRDGRLVVDLHWALSRSYLPFPVPFETLWNRAQIVRIGGAEVPTLATEDLLPFLCLHGGKHMWERLLWVCDVAELIRAQPQLDLDLVLKRARESGSGRVLLLGLELARSVLGAPLPDGAMQVVQRDRAVGIMAARARCKLFPDRSSNASRSALATLVRASLFHLQIQERMRDKVRYLAQAAIPNPRDRDAVSLPRGIRFLHFFTRPIRLIGRYGLAGIRGA